MALYSSKALNLLFSDTNTNFTRCGVRGGAGNAVNMIVNHLGSVLAPFASEFNCVSWFYSIELKEFQQQQQQKDKNKNKKTLLLKDIIGGWEVFLLDCRLSLDLFL